MIRKLTNVLLAAVAGTLLLAASPVPADATCTPGYVQIKPKPHVELPRCEPYPR